MDTEQINTVVKIEYPEPSIAVIVMEDKENKNMFSKGIISGVEGAFERINKNNDLRAVVTRGYQQFFSCGGTKELLLNEFTTGKISYDELKFFKMPMECELPTIAAMQGHALGGGLAFACMHDFIFLSLESMYSANFMKYGFTPGMLSTFNLPRRFGSDLGREMLMTAKNYTGKELIDRRAPLQIFPKDDVFNKAMALAKKLIDKPRDSMSLLKQHLAKPIKDAWSEFVEAEVKMHEQSMTTPETKERIQKLFED